MLSTQNLNPIKMIYNIWNVECLFGSNVFEDHMFENLC